MLSMIRKRLTYANVTMTLALVFAMAGGAYAANKIIITSVKQIKPSVVKQLRGKTGKQGPAGPAGVQGSQGAVGATGKEGAKGANGTNGTNGINGTSVTGKQLSTSEAACNKEGGSEFTAAEGKKTTACNGTTGFTSTLPSGKTETGAWVAEGVDQAGGEPKRTAISFSIPLAEMPEEVIPVPIGGPTPAGCSGNVDEPSAEPGRFCLFEGALPGHNEGLKLSATLRPGGVGAGTTGVELLFTTISPGTPGGPATAGEIVTAEGTWAVTAK